MVQNGIFHNAVQSLRSFLIVPRNIPRFDTHSPSERHLGRIADTPNFPERHFEAIDSGGRSHPNECDLGCRP